MPGTQSISVRPFLFFFSIYLLASIVCYFVAFQGESALIERRLILIKHDDRDIIFIIFNGLFFSVFAQVREQE